MQSYFKKSRLDNLFIVRKIDIYASIYPPSKSLSLEFVLSCISTFKHANDLFFGSQQEGVDILFWNNTIG